MPKRHNSLPSSSFTAYRFPSPAPNNTIESTTTGGDTFAKHQAAVKVVERCDGKLGLAEAMVKATGITG